MIRATIAPLKHRFRITKMAVIISATLLKKRVMQRVSNGKRGTR